MLIVIDAYNLLKQIYGPAVSESQRAEYRALLNAYAAMKHHQIMLVFDGGFFTHAFREKQGNVISIEVGKNRIADHFIMDYIAQHKASDMMVVSSDRQLVDCGSKHDVMVLGSMIFNEYVQRALERPTMAKKSEMIYKLHPESQDEEIDALMLQASQNIAAKPEDQVTTKHRTTHKGAMPSKKERKILAILKKL